MKNIKWSKIGQFRDVKREITGRCDHNEWEYPTVEAKGTVKLHGTNIGITYDHGAIYIQTRNNVCDINGQKEDGEKQDTFTFDRFVRDNYDTLRDFLEGVAFIHNAPLFTIFGEWAGKGVLPSTGIAELEKAWYIFGAYIGDNDNKKEVDISGIKIPDFIHNIYTFPTYEMSIDYNRPGMVTEALEALTLDVEAKCPVSSARGVDGTGEGIVWMFTYKDEVYRFKVKGDKHSASKVKKMVTVDPEVIKATEDFITYAVTENRVRQAVIETGAQSMRDTGAVVRWVANDIIKEETATLDANNLEWKKVAGTCSKTAVKLFKSILNEM